MDVFYYNAPVISNNFLKLRTIIYTHIKQINKRMGYLPFPPLTSTSMPAPSTNCMLPSNNIAANTRTTSIEGIPNTDRHVCRKIKMKK